MCNGAPVADAGNNRDVSYNTTVQLDGTRSSDPDGQTLSFHWTVDSIPAGSTAMINEATNRTPTFLADVPGDYAFTLTVDDSVITSAPAHVTISAHNDAPNVVAAVTTNVITGVPTTLDGSATSDANSNPLAFTWSVIGPAGSTAVPADPSAATTTFVPDVDGDYQVSLAVDDGVATSSATKPVHSFHRVTLLPFEPYRVEYDTAHDRILLVTHSANALYVYDPATDALTTIALAQMPTALSIAPDGSRALVGDGSGFTAVNLQTLQAGSRISLAFGASDIVDAGDGWAYVFISTNTLTPEIRGVRITTGAVTLGSRAIYWDMRARLMPHTTSIYATDQILTEVFHFASGVATLTNSTSSLGLALTTSDDGTRFFAGGAPVYAADLTQVGQLQSNSWAVTESSATGSLLAIPASGTDPHADEHVDVYSYPGLVYDHSLTLPSYLDNGTPRVMHGRYMFLHKDGVHYSVVGQIDSLSTTWGVTNL